VRDLGSRNGTWVAGKKILSGEICTLAQNETLAFGTSLEKWTLEDDSPPGPSALTEEGERKLCHEGTLLLPSNDHPLVAVSLQSSGWLLEGDEIPSPVPVRNAERIEVGGNIFKLELPDATLTKFDGQTESTRDDGNQLSLRFFVAAAEEHIRVEVSYQGRNCCLGSRAHNYALLLMARRRQEDCANNHLSGECGWLYLDQLAQMLKTDRKQLNQLLWRAKHAFEQAGVPSNHLIERRPDAGMVRLGTQCVGVLPD
jgi:hypothetical protein